MSFLRPLCAQFVRHSSSLVSAATRPAKSLPKEIPHVIFNRPLQSSHSLQRRFSQSTASNPRARPMRRVGLLALLIGSIATSLYANKNSAASPNSGATVVFPSKEELEKALAPFSLEEVTSRIAATAIPHTLAFQCDETLLAEKAVPLRNSGIGNLLKTEVYQTKALTVFCPEAPRVPHHLAIALNRKGIKGLADISEEENGELFAAIKKIAEIYKSISIQGFVIAQFDTPQEGHLGRYVVEIIPHLPGFNDVKNIADKVDCNRYVLFRAANISPVSYPIQEEDTLRQAPFWQAAFRKESTPLTESDTKIEFPYVRQESHQAEAENILYHQLLEMFQDKGAKILPSNSLPFEAAMPRQVPQNIKSVTVAKCAFCDDAVIQRQLVYEYRDVEVFYNMRKGAKPGSCFLVLPKRHTEKVYGLTPSEIHNIGIVRKALTGVLKDAHPECQVFVYTQDSSSVGQTVPHSHEQVVALNPKTVAFTWTMMSIYPSGNVSNEEMLQVREDFGLKLEQKIKEIEGVEVSA